MNAKLTIGSKHISRDGAPFIMAEIGVNHDGDVGVAGRLVEHAHLAGADAVKFQLFDAGILLARTAGLVDYQKSSAADAEDLLSPLQLSAEQLAPLVRRAQGLGMAAVVTPFSVELVGACVAIGVDAIKIASPDLVNRPLIEAAIRTGLPMVVSSGAADLAEICRTVSWLHAGGALGRSVLLHCVSSYPTAVEHATLGAITALRHYFPRLPVGYSDHTTETFTGALAVAAGACFLEKHLTLDRTRKGPDHAASLEPAQFADYTGQARRGYAMRGPIAKEVQPAELAVRQQTRQSVTTRRALSAGTVLTREMLTIKRPGTGIPAADLETVLGQRINRDIPANTVLGCEDLQPASAASLTLVAHAARNCG